MTLKTIIVLIGVLITTSAFSCSCRYRPTTKEEYSQSDLVIEGKVISFDTVETADQVFLRFKIHVLEDFKTDYNMGDTIYVLTSSSISGCRYPFIPTRIYLIYANKADFTQKKRKRQIMANRDNTFVMSICRLTQQSNIEEKGRLKEITR